MKLPKKIFRIDPKEAYKIYLAEASKPKKKPEQKATITPADIQDPESYIILEGRAHGSYSYPDILVSTGKDYHNQNWNQAHQSLHQNNEFMLTIRQSADFINLLKSGSAYDGKGNQLPKSKTNSILDEILKVRAPWRSEWLDSKFTKSGKQLQITYHKIQPDGTIKETTEPLEECLMEDRKINLDHWLNNANSQGLPVKNTPKGDVYYLHPREGYVAGLGVDSGRAYLSCGGVPRYSYSSRGVRHAKIKA